MTTIHATFANESDLARAVDAILDRGIPSQEIGVILPGTAAPSEETPPPMAVEPESAAPSAAERRIPPVDVPIEDLLYIVYGVDAPPPPKLAPELPRLRKPVYRDEWDEPPYHFDALGCVIPDVHSKRDHHSRDSSAHAAAPAEHRHSVRGAERGAGIGAGVGLLLGVAMTVIPDLGLAGGALATGVATATAVAGGIVGGLYGYLAEEGVPAHRAEEISAHVEAGGPLLSVRLTGGPSPGEVIDILQRHGAISTEQSIRNGEPIQR